MDLWLGVFPDGLDFLDSRTTSGLFHEIPGTPWSFWAGVNFDEVPPLVSCVQKCKTVGLLVRKSVRFGAQEIEGTVVVSQVVSTVFDVFVYPVFISFPDFS